MSHSVATSMAKVAIIFDIDDTLLKEVSMKEFRDHEDVQQLRYEPSLRNVTRYQKKLIALKEGATLEKGKVIHYEFDKTTLTSTVVVRPAMISLIEHVIHLNETRSDKIVLLLASANDESRTSAVCEQLRIKSCQNKTLAELGFRAVPREYVMKSRHEKDVGSVRKWAGLNELCLGIIVDDKPNELINVTRADHKVVTPAFDRVAADLFLRNSKGSEIFESGEKTMQDDFRSALHVQ